MKERMSPEAREDLTVRVLMPRMPDVPREAIELGLEILESFETPDSVSALEAMMAAAMAAGGEVRG